MFTINEKTRVITTTDISDYVLGVVDDNNSSVREFKFDRYTEAGWDKSEGTITVSYTNANGELDGYTVPSTGITADEDSVIVKWVIGSKVCVEAGYVTFSICSKMSTGEKWGSENCGSGVVKDHTCAAN